MRDIKIKEVHVGCMACDAEKPPISDGSAFLAGIVTALLRDEFALCSRHFAGFRSAEQKITNSDLSWRRTPDARPQSGTGTEDP